MALAATILACSKGLWCRRVTAKTTSASTCSGEQKAPQTTTRINRATRALSPLRVTSFQLVMRDPVRSRAERTETAATKAANARAHRERYEDARVMARATSPAKVFGSWV